MPKNRKRNTQKRAKEAKSFMEVPSRKITRLEHARQNISKLLTNTFKQNCPEFVMLNKKETVEKLSRKMLIKIKDFRKQGFYFYFLLIYLLYIFYGINDLVKN